MRRSRTALASLAWSKKNAIRQFEHVWAAYVCPKIRYKEISRQAREYVAPGCWPASMLAAKFRGCCDRLQRRLLPYKFVLLAREVATMTGFEGSLLGMGNPLLDIISDVDQAFLDKYKVPKRAYPLERCTLIDQSQLIGGEVHPIWVVFERPKRGFKTLKSV